MNGWPAVSSEETPWRLSDDDAVFIPKAKRRKITATYRAAIPALLSERTLTLPSELIEQLSDALNLAMAIAQKTSALAQGIINDWHGRITERSGAKIHELPTLLVEQPVVDSAYVASHLGITQRAATTLINRACEYGILRPLGNARRGDFYQAPAMLDMLDSVSSIAGIRRLMAQG